MAFFSLPYRCLDPGQHQLLCVQVPESNRALPVFVGHGTSDTLLPSFLAQATLGILKQQGIRDAEQHIYQGLGHATNAQELDDVKDWLAKVIPEARITRYTSGSAELFSSSVFGGRFWTQLVNHMLPAGCREGLQEMSGELPLQHLASIVHKASGCCAWHECTSDCELSAAAAKQLKAFLASKGISTAGMLEKQEFLESAQRAL